MSLISWQYVNRILKKKKVIFNGILRILICATIKMPLWIIFTKNYPFNTSKTIQTIVQ